MPGVLKSGALITLLLPLPALAQSDSSSARSYIVPALEIIGFDALLNVFDRTVLGDPYHSSISSIRRNLRRRWVTENDPFAINQAGHPYQGAMYHGFARASGLNFWTSIRIIAFSPANHACAWTPKSFGIRHLWPAVCFLTRLAVRPFFRRNRTVS